MAIITFHCFCLRNRTQIVDSFKLLVLNLYMMPWTMVVTFGISASCLFAILFYKKWKNPFGYQPLIRTTGTFRARMGRVIRRGI